MSTRPSVHSLLPSTQSESEIRTKCWRATGGVFTLRLRGSLPLGVFGVFGDFGEPGVLLPLAGFRFAEGFAFGDAFRFGDAFGFDFGVALPFAAAFGLHFAFALFLATGADLALIAELRPGDKVRSYSNRLLGSDKTV